MCPLADNPANSVNRAFFSLLESSFPLPCENSPELSFSATNRRFSRSSPPKSPSRSFRSPVSSPHPHLWGSLISIAALLFSQIPPSCHWIDGVPCPCFPQVLSVQPYFFFFHFAFWAFFRTMSQSLLLFPFLVKGPPRHVMFGSNSVSVPSPPPRTPPVSLVPFFFFFAELELEERFHPPAHPTGVPWMTGMQKLPNLNKNRIICLSAPSYSEVFF